jgi:hypothetical protein
MIPFKSRINTENLTSNEDGKGTFRLQVGFNKTQEAG